MTGLLVQAHFLVLSPIEHTSHRLLGYVHTTPELEFENDGFTLKSSNDFHAYYAVGISKRNNYQSFWICV